MRQYLLPYSETVTGTFVLMTVYIPPTLLATSQAHSKRMGLETSRLSCDMVEEQVWDDKKDMKRIYDRDVTHPIRRAVRELDKRFT